MSLIIALRSPIIGTQGFDALTRQIAAASSALGGTILSMQCLAQLVSANTDEGQLSKTFQIKAATEAAGGTLLSPSCLYNLIKNNWQ